MNHKTSALLISAVLISNMLLLTGCDTSNHKTGMTDLTKDQVEQLNTKDDGYTKMLLSKSCNTVNMELVPSIDTDIIDVSVFETTMYIDMFNESNCINLAELMKFGEKPFYVYKDNITKSVDIQWGPDKIKSVGNIFNRFYTISSTYENAELSLFYTICEKYLDDNAILCMDIEDMPRMDVDSIEKIKTYMMGPDAADAKIISVYRKDTDTGMESLRLKYDIETKTLKTTSWEPDTVTLDSSEVDYNSDITEVRFAEISLPFFCGARHSVVPANIPINGITLAYGADEHGKYAGKIDAEFICNEEQAAQIMQFYTKYYDNVTLEPNRIVISDTNKTDDEYIVTVSTLDDKYKVLVFCRQNM